MTHVLLFATRASADGSATALLPAGDSTVIVSLVGTLRSLSADAITVISRPAWAADLRGRGLTVVESRDLAEDLATVAATAAKSSGPVVLAAADIVAHRAALAKFAGVRATRTLAAITVDGGTDATAQPVLRQRDQVISVGTHAHDVTGPNALFRGLLAIGIGDLDALVDACSALHEYSDDLDGIAGDYGTVGVILLAMVRSGVPVPAYHLRYLQVNRIADAAGAKTAYDGLATVHERQASLRTAVKEDDDLFATVAVHPITPKIVSIFARLGVTANTVTVISIMVAAGAAVSFGVGHRAYWVLGAVLLYASFALDCCDGELARFTGRTSRYGGWFDMIADRAKEYAVYAGLAVGGVRAGESGVWALALAAIVLQTVRHVIDTWYGALQEAATRLLAPVPLSSRPDALGRRGAGAAVAMGAGADPADATGTARAVGAAGHGSGVVDASGSDGAVAGRPGGTTARIGTKLGRLSAAAQSERHSATYWLKRTVVLPIGERWLLLGLVTAVFTPKVGLITLLACGGLAFGYVLAGRTLRALSIRLAVLPRFDIALQRDDGPLARMLGQRVAPLPLPLPAVFAALTTLAVGLAGEPEGGRIWVAIGLGLLALAPVLGARAAHAGALDWLVPTALRAMEYTFILVAGVYGGVPLPLIYGLLAAIVLLHYDIVSRIEKAATPLRLTRTALGWDGRIILLAAFTAAGYATLGAAILTAIVGATLVVGCAIGLRRAPVSTPRRAPAAAAVPARAPARTHR